MYSFCNPLLLLLQKQRMALLESFYTTVQTLLAHHIHLPVIKPLWHLVLLSSLQLQPRDSIRAAPWVFADSLPSLNSYKNPSELHPNRNVWNEKGEYWRIIKKDKWKTLNWPFCVGGSSLKNAMRCFVKNYKKCQFPKHMKNLHSYWTMLATCSQQYDWSSWS